jgi:hypothetical protein
VPKAISKLILATAMLLAAAGCGYDTSATFNSDGSVTVGLKLLFPKELMQGSNGVAVSGFSASDVAAANASLQKQYPGAKVSIIAEGDDSGALITVPFKTEKDAFKFLTAPSKLTPSGATSGSGVSMNLSNTGGLFSSASHTTAGQTDTYQFTTVPQPMASPSPGTQQVISDSEVASIFVITFSLSLPHQITSAPGALFTLDRKTAIWKLSWTKAQTLTATTGPDVGLVANVAPAAADSRLVIAIGFVAVALGFLLGALIPWRGMRRAVPQPAGATAVAEPALPETAPVEPPGLWPGPPPEAPPPSV